MKSKKNIKKLKRIGIWRSYYIVVVTFGLYLFIGVLLLLMYYKISRSLSRSMAFLGSIGNETDVFVNADTNNKRIDSLKTSMKFKEAEQLEKAPVLEKGTYTRAKKLRFDNTC